MRTANRTSDGWCEWCENGLTVVSTRRDGSAEVEEYGPCPWCELGAEKEFPAKKKWPDGPQWGKDGYWRGRAPVVQRPPADGEPLSARENYLRLRLLSSRYFGDPSADPALGLGEPVKERLRLLEAAVGTEERGE